jgi:hypothetical protein
MDDDIEREVPEIIAPSQAAWATYVTTQYLDRDAMGPAHRAFLAGYGAGYSEGYSDADAGG